MRWLFLDSLGWDYDVSTPLHRPLGGSQSAMCYLATALARRGHVVSVANGIAEPRRVENVECLPLANLAAEHLRSSDFVVVLNGPAEAALTIRPHLRPDTCLVLWNQHAANQPAVQGLQDATIAAAWDQIVCVSAWHRETFHKAFALEPQRTSVKRNAIGPAFENLFGSRDALWAAKDPHLLAYTSTPYRGLNVLVALFPSVRLAFPECRCQVFSSMKVYQQDAANDGFEKLYERCKNTAGMEWKGSIGQADLVRALMPASILAYPNTFAETSCIAVMEALAAGMCVVSTSLGALAETSLGWASLVRPMDENRDVEAYARDYFQVLAQTLHQAMAGSVEFFDDRWSQVQQVNADCTWAQRAWEWEQWGMAWRNR